MRAVKPEFPNDYSAHHFHVGCATFLRILRATQLSRDSYVVVTTNFGLAILENSGESSDLQQVANPRFHLSKSAMNSDTGWTPLICR